MPTIARRTIALAALAVAIIAAAVALDLPSVSAQSEDEQTGRIVARRLDDGRTEFAWQPTGGERVLPRLRYFPANVEHNRWLNSSPIEVDGEEIGRINARQSEDGRIEFAFTPTDGERILPPSRYFPTTARVDRWLRSTEIKISGAPAAGFIAVSAGTHHTCGLRAGGEITCWGSNADFGEYVGQSDAPEGRFVAVSAGNALTCAIRESGGITCWGETTRIEQNPLMGRYKALEAGWYGVCGIREGGEIECAGEEVPSDEDVRSGPYSAVSTGGTGSGRPGYHTCGVRESGEIECWGNNEVFSFKNDGEEDWVWYGQATPPDGSFTAVSAGGYITCGLRDTGEITCWGSNNYGLTTPPTGSFTAVSAGVNHSCAIREAGEIECWGWDHYGETNVPAGSFSAVSVGLSHTCGLRNAGAIECWGSNEHGQTDAPDP